MKAVAVDFGMRQLGLNRQKIRLPQVNGNLLDCGSLLICPGVQICRKCLFRPLLKDSENHSSLDVRNHQNVLPMPLFEGNFINTELANALGNINLLRWLDGWVVRWFVFTNNPTTQPPNHLPTTPSFLPKQQAVYLLKAAPPTRRKQILLIATRITAFRGDGR